MKGTPKVTAFIIIIAALQALGIATVGILKIEHLHYPTYLTYLVNFSIEGAYIITLLYLQHVLIYINQKRAVILAVWVYIVYDAFAFLLRIYVVGTSIINGNWLFNLVYIAVTLYFIIQVFNVSNSNLGKSFRLLAITILLSGLIRTVAAVLLIQHYAGRSMLWYMVAAELLPPFAMLYILYKISAYLNREQGAFKQAALQSDEPA